MNLFQEWDETLFYVLFHSMNWNRFQAGNDRNVQTNSIKISWKMFFSHSSLNISIAEREHVNRLLFIYCFIWNAFTGNSVRLFEVKLLRIHASRIQNFFNLQKLYSDTDFFFAPLYFKWNSFEKSYQHFNLLFSL